LRLAKHFQFIPLQNVVYFITFPVLVPKIFTFYINDVLLFNVLFRTKELNLKVHAVTCGFRNPSTWYFKCGGWKGINVYGGKRVRNFAQNQLSQDRV